MVLVGGHSARSREVCTELGEKLGCEVEFFHAIDPEPEVRHVNDLIAFLRRETKSQVDCVVAVGGGSVIDVAKAAAALAPVTDKADDFFFGRRAIERRGIPLVALPTTAGTGAEITKNSVLIERASKIKQSIRSIHMIAGAAVCDAELTYCMPAHLTAHSGMDALTQGIEAFCSRSATDTTRSFALNGIRLIMQYLPRAFADGADREARNGMCEGSLWVALSFSQSSLGAVHGLAHPIGSLLGIAHGLCCAILLPHVLELNIRLGAQIIETLAEAIGFHGKVSDLIREIRTFNRQFGIPENVAPFGLNREHFEFVLKHCRSSSMRNNPVELSDDDILNFLEKLC
ncbi:MAG: iron-containing alcohol dehydrogenase [Lentisphaerae bacterium]|nr:MAG: iron-containing alcohol dehydrogenase [Lentisphaerota bacterium]